MDLASLKIEHYRGPDKMPSAVVRYPLAAEIDDRQVLVVDDVCDSGESFEAALAHLAQKGRPSGLRTAVLHHKQTARLRPDYYGQRVLKWRWITYPWALVEDLTALAGRLDEPPRTGEDLRQNLATMYRLTLPAGLFADIAPIVIDALERLRASDG
jgi:hypoxanthine phosphoribosyltransferase